MLAIISPAKTLDFKTNIDGFAFFSTKFDRL